MAAIFTVVRVSILPRSHLKYLLCHAATLSYHQIMNKYIKYTVGRLYVHFSICGCGVFRSAGALEFQQFSSSTNASNVFQFVRHSWLFISFVGISTSGQIWAFVYLVIYFFYFFLNLCSFSIHSCNSDMFLVQTY